LIACLRKNKDEKLTKDVLVITLSFQHRFLFFINKLKKKEFLIVSEVKIE